MGRRSRQKNSSVGRGLTTYTRPLPAVTVPRPTVPLRAPQNFVARLEDRRLFHPDLLPTRGARPPASVFRAARVLVERSRTPRRSLGAFRPARGFQPGRLSFAEPDLVSLCAKRKIRKQVLHAKGKTGAGVRKRRPRRNFWSSISC